MLTRHILAICKWMSFCLALGPGPYFPRHWCQEYVMKMSCVRPGAYTHIKGAIFTLSVMACVTLRFAKHSAVLTHTRNNLHSTWHGIAVCWKDAVNRLRQEVPELVKKKAIIRDTCSATDCQMLRTQPMSKKDKYSPTQVLLPSVWLLFSSQNVSPLTFRQ